MFSLFSTTLMVIKNIPNTAYVKFITICFAVPEYESTKRLMAVRFIVLLCFLKMRFSRITNI